MSVTAPHGFRAAGTRANTSDQTKFARKTSIDAPSTNAETEAQSLRNCRCDG